MDTEKLTYVVYGDRGYYCEYDGVIGFTMLIETALHFPNEDTAYDAIRSYPEQLKCTLKVMPIKITFEEPEWKHK